MLVRARRAAAPGAGAAPMSAALPVLGLDLGGTKVAAGLVGADGTVRARRTLTTAELRASGDVPGRLVALGREVLAAGGVPVPAAVGVALPGPVRREGLRLLAAPTLPELCGVELAPLLAAAFRCPVAGDNDANDAALGEARFGAGRGCRYVVYFTISTGIGGGVVLDGRLLRGARGTAAELGHQVIVPEGGPPCDCGGSGCLEALASGRAIARRGRHCFDPGLPPGSAADLAELARHGHAAARRVWDETALYLGLGIANAINLFDPDVVVCGGGVAVGAWDLLEAPVRRVLAERCMPSLPRGVRLAPAALGADAGIVGAAAAALDSEAVLWPSPEV